MQDLTLVFALISLILSCVACVLASARWRASKVRKELGLLRVAYADLYELYSALQDSHKRLRSRIGMRELREKRKQNPESTVPDPNSDPDGWKKYMRTQIHRAK